jgi:hypothetical protein
LPGGVTIGTNGTIDPIELIHRTMTFQLTKAIIGTQSKASANRRQAEKSVGEKGETPDLPIDQFLRTVAMGTAC